LGQKLPAIAIASAFSHRWRGPEAAPPDAHLALEKAGED